MRVRDREHLEAAVSDRMIWVMPTAENRRGKQDWIEASCAVTWNWFEVEICREIDLGDARVVESWVRLSRDPVASEEVSEPVIGAGPILDVWAIENGAWRLVARHPQRADA